jgi:hypothetical protein
MAAAPAPASAQSAGQESKLAADLRHQRERLADKCGHFGGKTIVDCGATLVTDHPFHLAIGSIAPQNGFGLGVAFVAPQSKPNEDWRINWSADAVGTPSGAWRAGAYATFVRTHVGAIGVTGPGGGTAPGEAQPRPYPTIKTYVQTSTLPALAYFGAGNESSVDGRALFAMRHSIVGTRVVWPIGRTGWLNRLNASAIGELNGRWIRVTDSSETSQSPPMRARYSEATAPGLDTQPATLQAGEGLRLAPAVGRLQLTYTGTLQQFAAADPAFSFRRWTVDLRHEFGLWTSARRADARENNGPNECAASADRLAGEYGCPDPAAVTTNRVGTVGFRVLASRSGVSDGARVPFYLQRTIGGSDIDGERLLASFDDYRFRAPNILVLQETIEHAIWGPIGAFAAAEQGRVALITGSLRSGPLRKTAGAGLTLRAGGVPLMTVWWAAGGGEGHHLAFTMSTSLLGGSSRPSLH